MDRIATCCRCRRIMYRLPGRACPHCGEPEPLARRPGLIGNSAYERKGRCARRDAAAPQDCSACRIIHQCPHYLRFQPLPLPEAGRQTAAEPKSSPAE